MNFSRLTQAQLHRQVERFVKNGREPVAQAVISGVGYGLDKLAEGQTMLDRWSDSKARRLTLRTEQKQATRSETDAAGLAEIELGLLREALQVVFEDNVPLLTTLGIYPRRHNGTGSNGDANGQADNEAPLSSEAKPTEPAEADQVMSTEAQTDEPPTDQNGDATEAEPKKRRRKGVAEAKLEQQRLFIGHVQDLPQADLDRLANAGWSAARLAETADLIEGVASADDDQHKRMSTRAAESKRCQQYEAELRQWYRQAVRLCLTAIKKLPLDQQVELLRLLGLK